MVKLHLDKDRMYTDRVVVGSVVFNERSHKSLNMLQSYCRGLWLEVRRTTTNQLRVIEEIDADEGNNKTKSRCFTKRLADRVKSRSPKIEGMI